MTPPRPGEASSAGRRVGVRVVRVVWTASGVLLIIVLAGVAFFHAVSGTWAFNLGWNPRAEEGGEQRQFYLQGVREPGTLLAGWRRETKMSDVPFPEFFWTLGKPLPDAPRRGSTSELGSPRPYTGGVFLQSQDRAELHFHARYLYLRFWLLETILCLLLAALWLPVLIRRKGAGRAAPGAER